MIPHPSLRHTVLLLGLAATVLSSTVRAVVIGFEGTGVDPNGVISPVPLPYTESGFVLRNGIPAAESGIFGEDTGGEENSGSDFFGWHFNGRIILEAESGEAFTLNSIDAGHIGAIMGLPDVLPLEITGNLEGGGTVMTTIDFTIPWQTFVLPATFTNLVSVEFYTGFDGGGGIDDLVINQRGVGVSEGGDALMLAGVAVLALVWFGGRAKLKRGEKVLPRA